MRHLAQAVLLSGLLGGLPACSSSDSGGGTEGGSDAGSGGAGSGGAGSGGTGSGGADAGACPPVGSVEEAVRVYGEAWRDRDPESRACKLRRALVDSATYVDPTVDTETSAALAEAIGTFQSTFPDGSIEEVTGLDARDGELRFGWDFLNGGASFVKGEDYMELAPDGRISSIRGYWEPLPPGSPAASPVLEAYVLALGDADASTREAGLALAVAEDVRFTAPGGVDVTGLSALSATLGAAGLKSVSVLGNQSYPKYARVAMTVTLGDDTTKDVTDYAHLGPDGKMTRVARFEGALPPLP